MYSRAAAGSGTAQPPARHKCTQQELSPAHGRVSSNDPSPRECLAERGAPHWSQIQRIPGSHGRRSPVESSRFCCFRQEEIYGVHTLCQPLARSWHLVVLRMVSVALLVPRVCLLVGAPLPVNTTRNSLATCKVSPLLGSDRIGLIPFPGLLPSSS